MAVAEGKLLGPLRMAQLALGHNWAQLGMQLWPPPLALYTDWPLSLNDSLEQEKAGAASKVRRTQ